MRCVAYVSKSPMGEDSIRLPVEMSNIIRVSRKFNLSAQITGRITYRKGQYFQIIEGPYHEINTLFERIAADTRHKDIWVLIDKPISERCFPDWGIGAFDFSDQSAFFKKFVENNKQQISGFSEQQKQRIHLFIDLEAADSKNEAVYDGKQLRLLAWPDIDDFSQSQVIGLCVKLTKQPYAFDSLVSEGEFGSYHQITEMIRGFENTGILTIIEPSPSSAIASIVQPKKPSKFYSAIKRFLKMG